MVLTVEQNIPLRNRPEGRAQAQAQGPPGKRKLPVEPSNAPTKPAKLTRAEGPTGSSSSSLHAKSRAPPPAKGQARAQPQRKEVVKPKPAPQNAPPRGQSTNTDRPVNGGQACSEVPSTAEAELREQLAVQREDNEHLTAEFEKLQQKRDELEKRLGIRQDELEREQSARRDAETGREKAEEEIAQLKVRLDAAETQSAAAEEAARRLEEQNSDLQSRLDLALSDAEQLAERGRAQEQLRRQMHETISELKGSIRVFCRVRPNGSAANAPNGAPGAATARSLVRVPSGQIEPTGLELMPPPDSGEKGHGTPAATSGKAQQRFKFDRVFAEGASQLDVFREVSQLTQSALDGYKVCIFAYGQTGSGKTFTMEGAAGEARGVVPRATEQVFSTARELKLLGWSFEFRASCLEIYNEELRDLLPSEGAAKSDKKLKISDANGVVAVPGLRSAKVDDANDLEVLLTQAARARATAATRCNEHSSRSHYVFRMTLKGVNERTNERTEGELNLIDLAGSERTKESGVEGQAMKEANAINKSLSSLGDVISAMGDAKAKHVPYRNSKLTHLLQNALSGSAKTLMFVNVHPGAKHHSESLSSLRFASKVGGVEIGPAAQKKERAN